MRRLSYFIAEALANIRLNQTTTIVAIATTAFTMVSFGVFLLLYLNLRGATTSMQDDIKVILYVHDGLSLADLYELEKHLKGEREVAGVDYVSKEQALSEFRKDFPADSSLLQGLGENPLPASFVVTIRPQFRSSDSVQRWVDRARMLPGIAQVQYNQDWIESLAVMVRYLEWTAIAVGAILSAAAVTIIASTIRLALYARRDDIEIMRLIGATPIFIRVPYLIEGAVLGALGGALSVSLLKAGFEFFKLQLGTHGRLLAGPVPFSFLPDHVSLAMVIAGLALGSIGSFVSLAAFERTRA